MRAWQVPYALGRSPIEISRIRKVQHYSVIVQRLLCSNFILIIYVVYTVAEVVGVTKCINVNNVNTSGLMRL